MSIHTFFLARLHFGFKKTLYECKFIYVIILTISINVTFLGCLFYLYGIIWTDACTDENVFRGTVLAVIFDVLWSFVMAGTFLYRLRDTVKTQLSMLKNEGIIDPVTKKKPKSVVKYATKSFKFYYTMFKLFVLFVSAIFSLFSIYIMREIFGVLTGPICIDQIVSNILLLLSFQTFDVYYRKMCCCYVSIQGCFLGDLYANAMNIDTTIVDKVRRISQFSKNSDDQSQSNRTNNDQSMSNKLDNIEEEPDEQDSFNTDDSVNNPIPIGHQIELNVRNGNNNISGNTTPIELHAVQSDEHE